MSDIYLNLYQEPVKLALKIISQIVKQIIKVYLSQKSKSFLIWYANLLIRHFIRLIHRLKLFYCVINYEGDV